VYVEKTTRAQTSILSREV